jgi:hypothetical protein
VRSELHANKGDIKREPITAKNDKNALQLIVEELWGKWGSLLKSKKQSNARNAGNKPRLRDTGRNSAQRNAVWAIGWSATHELPLQIYNK